MTSTGNKKKVCPLDIDVYKTYTLEEIEADCIDNDLPLNFYKLSVQERRDAIHERWKRWADLETKKRLDKGGRSYYKEDK